MKKIQLSVLQFMIMLITTLCMNAQVSLNVASNKVTLIDMVHEYSIGEMTFVSTNRNSSLILTQGFLQPFLNPSHIQINDEVNNLINLTKQINIYPNPTQHLLNIETVESSVGDFQYQLFDAAGRIVLSQKVQTTLGINKFTMDLRGFVTGNYFMMISTVNDKGEPMNNSYKIQKLN